MAKFRAAMLVSLASIDTITGEIMNSKERFKAAIVRVREISDKVPQFFEFNSELNSALEEYHNAYMSFKEDLKS